MSPNRIETVDDLHEIIGAQNAAIDGLHTLVKAMDLRIRTLTNLVDATYAVLERQGFVKPRPGEDHLVN
jgi:hypothetical protein